MTKTIKDLCKEFPDGCKPCPFQPICVMSDDICSLLNLMNLMMSIPERRIVAMLRDEVELYSKLTGKDGWHVPIIKIGAYLDGYYKGLEEADNIKAENENNDSRS